MKLLFTALVLLVSASFAFSQALWSRAKTTPENGSKYGIILSDGSWLIEPNYDDIRIQYEYANDGFVYFIVEQNDKLGLINHLGNVILPVQFDVIVPYVHYLEVDIDGKKAAFSRSGKKIMDFTDGEISTLFDHESLNLSFYDPFIGFGKEGHYGVIDTSGNIIVPPNYDYINNIGNFFKVTKGTKISIFNQQGTRLQTDRFNDFYKNPHSMSEPSGYLMAKADETWGLIDSLGNVVIEPVYSAVVPKREFIELYVDDFKGIALYSGEVILEPIYQQIILENNERFFKYGRNLKWGLCTIEGKEILPTEYKEIDFDYEFILVKKNKLYGILDYSGKLILEVDYDQIIADDDVFLVEKNGLWGAHSKDGVPILPLVYESITFNQTIFITKVNGVFDAYTSNGKLLIAGASEIKPYSELLFSKKNNLWGAKSIEGVDVIPPSYSEIGSAIRSSLLAAKKNGKWGYISPSGEVKIPFMYETAENFSNKTAKVSKNGTIFSIDTSNKRVPEYQSSNPFSSASGNGSGGVAREAAPPTKDFFNYYLKDNLLKAVWSSDKVGLLRGEPQIVPSEFDELVISKHQIIHVKKDGRWGAYDFSGKQLITPSFTELTYFYSLTKTGSSFYEDACGRYTGKSKKLEMVENSPELRYHVEHYFKLYKKQADRLGYYPRPEKQPNYSWSEDELISFISSNLVYPKKGRKLTEKTTVMVNCYVEPTGKLIFLDFEDATIPAYFLDEAERVVLEMGSWRPGTFNGEYVKTKVTIPIVFDPSTYSKQKSN